MENEENNFNSRLSNIEEKIREINSRKGSGWNSNIEKYIISAGLFLLFLSFIVVSYNAITSEIIISDKLIGIITVLLGYLFGYLPLKTSESQAIKKLEEFEKNFITSQQALKKLQSIRSIAENALKQLSEARDENEQLKKAIEILRAENEEYKNYLKELVDLK